MKDDAAPGSLPSSWITEEMSDTVAEVLEQYDFEPLFAEGAARLILEAISPMVDELIRERVQEEREAIYEYASRIL